MNLSLQKLRTGRLSLGVTTAVMISYGVGWPLSFLAPIFTVMFLAQPGWLGWNAAAKILILLCVSLLAGVFISEFLLNYPLLCVPVYGLLFFLIYYNDTPSSPPMVSLFMTLGIAMIPILSFAGEGVAPLVALFLMVNMAAGMFFAWFFHSLLPEQIIQQPGQAAPAKSPPEAPAVPEKERIRLAMVSTIVASSAVIIFFSLNLVQYALAMFLICVMAGTPNQNASIQVVKANSLATLIGGIAAIIAFNLLVAVPTYLFLICLTLCFSIFFSGKIYAGGPYSAAYGSGFTTFLILLGSSTGADKTAAADFYLRIAQILLAGLFTIYALMIVERLLRPRSWRLPTIFSR